MSYMLHIICAIDEGSAVVVVEILEGTFDNFNGVGFLEED